MGSLSTGRQRWTLEHRRREPSLYDEWLNQAKPSSQHSLFHPPQHRDSASSPTSPSSPGRFHAPQPPRRDSTSAFPFPLVGDDTDTITPSCYEPDNTANITSSEAGTPDVYRPTLDTHQQPEHIQGYALRPRHDAQSPTQPIAPRDTTTPTASPSPGAVPRGGDDAPDFTPHHRSAMASSNAAHVGYDRHFSPSSTTATPSAPAPAFDDFPQLPPNVPETSFTRRHHNRRLTHDRERERERDMRYAASNSPSTPSRNGVRGPLTRSASRGQAEWTERERAVAAATLNAARPRTRTLEERSRRELSPLGAGVKSRDRVGSVAGPVYPSHGVEYLASVPAVTAPPAAPSISSLGSPVQPVDDSHRSVSPLSSEGASSLTSQLPSANARRIRHLMRTLGGKMSGNVYFRRGLGSPWAQIYCSVSQETTSLIYEIKNGESTYRTLVPELRGCVVRPELDGDAPFLEVAAPHTTTAVHIRLTTQADFDAWFATFLYWQGKATRSPPASTAVATATDVTPPDLPPRPASARPRERRNSVASIKSVRRQSVVASLKEAPVIKIGKMIFWDTHGGATLTAAHIPLGQPSTTRPDVPRMQSFGSKRWRRISGQLRENGELKLHADADNSLISVVQLSQLSRCAIQRLDHSVLDCDFCIAIYPQYTATSSSTQAAFLRPMFLSLENRVLYEVWFVLLRAFTIPQLYGPANASDDPDDDDDTDDENDDDDDEDGGDESDGQRKDLDHMLATTTADMFRVERSLTVRIVEAKIYPTGGAGAADSSSSTAHGKHSHANNKAQNDGYFAEISLDNETRGRTSVKHEGLNPLWGESFDFLDLPSVLGSASVVIKKRSPNSAKYKDHLDKRPHGDPHAFAMEQTGGVTAITCDITCGKVEIHIQELEETEKEVEKWWPVINTAGECVGEVLIKARAEEGVILMARDYQALGDVLHRFSNSLSLQIAQMISGELKRLSDCLLNIFQVSGRAGDWLMSLIEEEIDGLHKETPIQRLRYAKRTGSNETNDTLGTGGGTTDREMIVRDLNKNAAVEANLLFRGNTLLTKSLDTHMRRVGKEYLEESLAAKIQEINDKDPDCEVDPNRATSPGEAERNWKRLLYYTQDVWKAIVAARHRCPVELRVIFRHIRACAEDRYGDFLRTVSYSSVSGFLFLRFFCPAVLNPKLFALVKVDIKPRARRTLTLIAKSLQTMANMATFGSKEQWMLPMNAFLAQHRETFKSFIDDVCYVPSTLSNSSMPYSPATSPRSSPTIVTTETHLSYTTPMTIMQRLPPTSREGFPSLPYLLDQARAFADLVQLWLEVVNPALQPNGSLSTSNSRRRSEILHVVQESGGDLAAFHQICTTLNARTQDCLNRAERAERPNSSTSFPWEDLIDQLQSTHGPDGPGAALAGADDGVDSYDDRSSTTRATRMRPPKDLWLPGMQGPGGSATQSPRSLRWATGTASDDESNGPRSNDYASAFADPARSYEHPATSLEREADRPSSSGLHAAASSITGNIRRVLQSRGSDHSPSASTSNISSAVTSDAELTTALPSYDREVQRHRERREAAKAQIQQQVEEAKAREREKEKRKKTPLAALRKRRDRDHNNTSSTSTVTTTTSTTIAGGRSHSTRGIDMSHV